MLGTSYRELPILINLKESPRLDADIGVVSSGAIKVGIEKGPVTLGTIYRVLAHAEPLYVLTIKGSLLFSLMQQGEERWGKARCFQYSGITINRENSTITDMSIAGNGTENRVKHYF
jgi:2',3'-cyclic-nucleotide 2'-phosphodiesterase (5'-nucleotidase family)